MSAQAWNRRSRNTIGTEPDRSYLITFNGPTGAIGHTIDERQPTDAPAT